MSSLGTRPTMVSTSCPFFSTTSVGMPRTWKRLVGTFGFSSTFILPMVARPAYSVASCSTIGAMRRQGPHHSAQKSTSTTPCFVSSSKLLSVKVFTFSDAMFRSHSHARCNCALVHLDVAPRRGRPRMILLHPGLLNPLPGPPIHKDAQSPPQGAEQRLRRILVERKPGPAPGGCVEVPHRVRQPTGGAHQRHRTVAQAVHLIEPARLESR